MALKSYNFVRVYKQYLWDLTEIGRKFGTLKKNHFQRIYCEYWISTTDETTFIAVIIFSSREYWTGIWTEPNPRILTFLTENDQTPNRTLFESKNRRRPEPDIFLKLFCEPNHRIRTVFFQRFLLGNEYNFSSTHTSYIIFGQSNSAWVKLMK